VLCDVLLFIMKVENGQMNVRGNPLSSQPFHGKTVTGYFLFIPPWLSIMLEDLDLTNIEHWKYLSWGRMIMPFECAISPTEAMTGETRPYAYIEEYWPYEPLHRDQLCR